ncbi:MAG: ferrochelatase [Polyangiaceae bacterium]|nr:ferrochelatase [Polyangiaceae bacterium]MCW5791376.1 ferrochelatase [Polyangiaceae bacterium]
MSRDAVLLVGHGTIDHPSQLPEFLRRIRRGRPAPAALLEELTRRYQAVGGSPLLRITEAQAAGVSERLGLPCHVAMRFWEPTLTSAAPELMAYDRVVVLPVAPYSVHVYSQVAREALSALPRAPELLTVEPYGAHPLYLAAWASLIRKEMNGATLPSAALDARPELLLTAHSLPLSVIQAGDPYRALVEASAAALLAQLGSEGRVVYQSEGGEGVWLGPSLLEHLRALGGALPRGEALREPAAREIWVAPLGFVADHIETLYDLDVEALAVARDAGLKLRRVPALNTHPLFLDCLAEVAEAALSGR